MKWIEVLAGVALCTMALSVSAKEFSHQPLRENLSGPVSARHEARQEAIGQLESIVQCREGTVFNMASLRSVFRALGMKERRTDMADLRYQGLFVADPADAPAILGEKIVAAMVREDESGVSAVDVYFATANAQQILRKLGLTQVNQFYRMGPSHILSVQGQDWIWSPDTNLEYSSAAECEYDVVPDRPTGIPVLPFKA